jgi:hypothetical protein
MRIGELINHYDYQTEETSYFSFETYIYITITFLFNGIKNTTLPCLLSQEKKKEKKSTLFPEQVFLIEFRKLWPGV